MITQKIAAWNCHFIHIYVNIIRINKKPTRKFTRVGIIFYIQFISLA